MLTDAKLGQSPRVNLDKATYWHKNSINGDFALLRKTERYHLSTYKLKY